MVWTVGLGWVVLVGAVVLVMALAIGVMVAENRELRRELEEVSPVYRGYM